VVAIQTVHLRNLSRGQSGSSCSEHPEHNKNNVPGQARPLGRRVMQANRAKPTPTRSKTASKSSVPPIMSAKRSIYFADPDGNGLKNLLRDAAGARVVLERARR
jgi:hypothetical protein